MRLFSALPLSPEAIDRLTSIQLRWSAPKDGLRWSAAEQWHITLQFYGEVDDARLTCLDSALRKEALTAPFLAMDRLDRFAAKGILFAEIESCPALLSLQAQVAQCAEQCGMRRDSRAFHPHITLARSKGRSGLSTLQRLASPNLPSIGPTLRWLPTELLLLESTLRPQGAVYRVVSTIKLNSSSVPKAPVY
jgi:RNA 2',3'-cyclic 3'-phosphodiesterase